MFFTSQNSQKFDTAKSLEQARDNLAKAFPDQTFEIVESKTVASNLFNQQIPRPLYPPQYCIVTKAIHILKSNDEKQAVESMKTVNLKSGSESELFPLPQFIATQPSLGINTVPDHSVWNITAVFCNPLHLHYLTRGVLNFATRASAETLKNTALKLIQGTGLQWVVKENHLEFKLLIPGTLAEAIRLAHQELKQRGFCYIPRMTMKRIAPEDIEDSVTFIIDDVLSLGALQEYAHSIKDVVKKAPPPVGTEKKSVQAALPPTDSNANESVAAHQSPSVSDANSSFLKKVDTSNLFSSFATAPSSVSGVTAPQALFSRGSKNAEEKEKPKEDKPVLYPLDLAKLQKEGAYLSPDVGVSMALGARVLMLLDYEKIPVQKKKEYGARCNIAFLQIHKEANSESNIEKGDMTFYFPDKTYAENLCKALLETGNFKSLVFKDISKEPIDLTTLLRKRMPSNTIYYATITMSVRDAIKLGNEYCLIDEYNEPQMKFLYDTNKLLDVYTKASQAISEEAAKLQTPVPQM